MDNLKMHSLDGVQRNIELIGKLFPNAITEVKRNGKVEYAIDFDVLRQELSDSIVEGREERYQFTWPDKKKAMLAANAPITATLRPVVADSVGKDGTPGGFDSENLYIEGDNLEVLKLLQETYLGKVKMIYIDPPYNTGNDFVYNDEFGMRSEEWNPASGNFDEDGNQLVGKLELNTESNGRFHTDWLNMIYPRLKIAKDLLASDGVIFISISEKEYSNLKKVLQEIFGEDNYIGTIIWKNSTDNNPTNIAEEHEYILAFAKQKILIDPIWKSRVSDVKMVLENIGSKLAKECHTIEELQQKYSIWYKENKNQLWPLDRYKYIDFGGVYTGSQSVHNPGKEGYRYDVIHPKTHKPCKQPLMGYRFPEETIKKLLDDGKILFGADENKIIELKLYASEYQEKLSSVFELDGRTGPYDLKALFPECVKAFTNPKPVYLIKKLSSFVLHKNDIVCDFFSGSATTAHAVMQLNAEDGGHRKFIMVQLPEKVNEKSEAYKAGYKNICEIGKERIRRAGRKIKEDAGLTAPADLDIGFRCLRLDESNMKPVYYTPDEVGQQDLFSLVDNVKEDRTPEDLLFQVMLDLGVLLSSPIEVKEIAGKKVFNVADGFLLACFDHDVTEETVKAIAQMKPYYAVFRDSSMANDSVATNFEQIFETYSPDTVRKVL
jgi:adenine-specific DNA-methyltransferase